MNFQIIRRYVMVVVAAVIVGCGPKVEPEYPVKGTVTLDDGPMAQGEVTFRDDAQAISQPLHCGTRDEHRTCECEGAPTVGESHCHGGEESVGRRRAMLTGVDEEEGTGAVGALRVPGTESNPSDECGLLITGHAADRDG